MVAIVLAGLVAVAEAAAIVVAFKLAEHLLVTIAFPTEVTIILLTSTWPIRDKLVVRPLIALCLKGLFE